MTGRYGIIDSFQFSIANIDFGCDLQDSSYYGGKGQYWVPSILIDDCWGIDFTKQFRTKENCQTYITKQVVKTAKQILKD